MSVTKLEQIRIEMAYRGYNVREKTVPYNDRLRKKYNDAALDLGLDSIQEYAPSQDFNIPNEYKNLNIEQYLAEKIRDPHDEVEVKRVCEELTLFKARNLYPILQLLIYIVDTMRENNVVWGVGRGSSVASYCLYLIGIHQINSIKYDIPITEFLK